MQFESHKPSDFLITTSVGPSSRRFIWRSNHIKDLDIPGGWAIERRPSGQLRILNLALQDAQKQIESAIEFNEPTEGSRKVVELPGPTPGSQRSLAVEIMHMRPLNPVYMMRHMVAPQYPPGTPKQLMGFYGQRYYMVRFSPVPPNKVITLNGNEVFRYTSAGGTYRITSASDGLKIKTASEKHSLSRGRAIALKETDFFSSALILDTHWWRFRMVPTPDSLPPIETEETDDDAREGTRIRYSAAAFYGLFVIGLIFMYVTGLHEKPKPKIVANVEIKAPKIIPPTKEELKPKPKPPEPQKIVEVKPQPEPPKVVEAKPEPKADPKPHRKVVKKERPHKKIVKKERPIPSKTVAKTKPHPPKPVATSPEPPPPAPAVAKKEPPANTGNAAAEKAAQTEAMKQQLLNKLSFLSTSSKRAEIDPQKYDDPSKEGRFTDTPSMGHDVSKSNSLDKLVKDAPGDGHIRTNSSRTVASRVSFGKNKGKGLNDVQGKVSLGEIYHGDQMGDFGGGGSLSISGLGSMNAAEIEKTLAKYLQRFQFCYEKALLSDSSLGGNLVMSWTINSSGGTQTPKVVSSQMNNKDLHDCVSKVLKEINFPHPKGGTIQVKKTFSFSSSTL